MARNRKARKRNTAELDLIQKYGSVPVFTGKSINDEDYNSNLSNAYSWCSEGLKPNEAVTELVLWMKENNYTPKQVKAIKSIEDWRCSTAGKTCFLIHNNWPMHNEVLDRLRKQVDNLLEVGYEALAEQEREKKEKSRLDKLREENKESATAVNLYEAVAICDEVEDTLFSSFEINSERVTALVKGKKITVLDRVISKISELQHELELFGEDDDVTEAYSYLKKSQVKSIIKNLDNVKTQAEMAKANKTARKSVRRKKAKSANAQVQKLNYLEYDKQYNIRSVDPITIVGATKVVVFNVRKRKLGIYHSNDDSGFTVKGTTLQNVDVALSEQKTLRDTKDSSIVDKLNDFRKARVKKIDKLFDNLTTTNVKLTGRLGKDDVILKVFK